MGDRYQVGFLDNHNRSINQLLHLPVLSSFHFCYINIQYILCHPQNVP